MKYRHVLFLPLIVLTLLPCTAWSEGAVRIIDCSITNNCDSGGACKTVTEKVIFRMEPMQIESDGSGYYKLSYRDIQAKMEALSILGPFYWIADKERDTLLISSENQFLWHRLRIDPVPDATIHYLTCTFRQ